MPKSNHSGEPSSHEKIRAQFITQSRLKSYLSASSGDLPKALELYDWNNNASGAVLSTTTMIEIAARNAMDMQLTLWAQKLNATTDWFDLLKLDGQGAQAISVQSQIKQLVNEKPVAER